MKEAMHKMMFKVIPSCRKAMELQSRALDGELGIGQRMLLRIHVMMCTICRRYARQLGYLKEIAREIPEKGAFAQDGSMPTEVKDRIREKLKDVETGGD